MIILTSKVILEHIGSEPEGDFDDFTQAAIDIMDEALENAKITIERNIKAKYGHGEQFEVSVI